MRAIIVGLGEQGRKRLSVAGSDSVATVDPVNPEADYKALEDAPLADFDAALLCTPDELKIGLISYLLDQGKHVLVEKPLLAPEEGGLTDLQMRANRSGAVCYTAYNHRFEPHIVRLKKAIEQGEMGHIYMARFFYGNGTARLVRQSPWRDRGAGVLTDLGSHLLDTVRFVFGDIGDDFHIWHANRFENLAFDHITFGSRGDPVLEMEASLISWRNHFTADVFGENGSAHIESLCKWGATTFTYRKRMIPSGRPPEESITLVQPDPTWELEYAHFKRLCAEGENGNFENDIWINRMLNSLSAEALGMAAQ